MSVTVHRFPVVFGFTAFLISEALFTEIHSPITTLEIICIMALTLEPIRGCPQHSGEMETWLSLAIHRRLFSQFFFLGRGDVCTQVNLQKNCENFLMSRIILLIKKFSELVEMTFGLVNASFSLPEWQAVKMTFFAPCPPTLVPCKSKHAA